MKPAQAQAIADALCSSRPYGWERIETAGRAKVAKPVAVAPGLTAGRGLKHDLAEAVLGDAGSSRPYGWERIETPAIFGKPMTAK